TGPDDVLETHIGGVEISSVDDEEHSGDEEERASNEALGIVPEDHIHRKDSHSGVDDGKEERYAEVYRILEQDRLVDLFFRGSDLPQRLVAFHALIGVGELLQGQDGRTRQEEDDAEVHPKEDD